MVARRKECVLTLLLCISEGFRRARIQDVLLNICIYAIGFYIPYYPFLPILRRDSITLFFPLLSGIPRSQRSMSSNL